MTGQEPLRLMLLIVGISVLALVGLTSLSLIAWLRRYRRQRQKSSRIRRRRPRRIMPDLWQAAGDRLAQQLTRQQYDQAQPPASRGDPGSEGFDVPQSAAEEERDGESWKHGKPYEPRYDPQDAAQAQDDDDEDEEDDEGDGDVPIPPAPHP